jgi:hypothetical protein
VREVTFTGDDRLHGSHFEAAKKYFLLGWQYSVVLCRQNLQNCPKETVIFSLSLAADVIAISVIDMMGKFLI